MGKLDELEDDLYGKDDGSFAGRAKKRVIFPRADFGREDGWAESAKEQPGKSAGAGTRAKKFFLIFGGAGVLFLLGAALFVYFYIGRQIPEASVKIQSRDFMEAGEEFTVPVSFVNTSKTALREVELAIVLPDGSLVREDDGVFRSSTPRVVKKIPDLASGEEENTEITARMFGKEGQALPLEATLSYRPENILARFSATGAKQVTVARVPLELSWDGPDTVSQKQDVAITAHVHSTARAPWENMWLRAEYPAGFSFSGADPKPDADTGFWNLGTVDSGADRAIVIRGAITGASGEIKAFRGGIGSYNKLTKSWRPWREAAKEFRVATAPLSLEVFLREGREHIVAPGERLNLVLRYRNDSGIPLKNISVRADLESALLDQSSVSLGEGGVADAQTQSLVWSPGGTPELASLAPGTGGELEFHIGTRPQPAVRTADDKNMIVRIRGRISSLSAPQEFSGTAIGMDDTLEMKVRSLVLFSGRALFRAAPIPTSGPLPPRVGAKTIYTVVWEVRNFTNDLENADIRVALPPNIKWEDAVYPKDAGISYDTASGQVHWHVGTIKAGTGVLSPALIGAFQVSLTPAVSDSGRMPTLIGESRFTAHDSFTAEDRDEKISALSTQLTNDPMTTFKDWSVVK